MEDRITPGLYLEMTDQPVDAYVRDRVPVVLAHAGVQRATWWRNVEARPHRSAAACCPSSTTSAVYEVDDAFRAPDAPDGVTGHHFRHYPRPGQGIVTGRPTVGLSLVLISPKDPARAQELRDWADFVHIRHIAEAAVPGLLHDHAVRERDRRRSRASCTSTRWTPTIPRPRSRR